VLSWCVGHTNSVHCVPQQTWLLQDTATPYQLFPTNIFIVTFHIRKPSLHLKPQHVQWSGEKKWNDSIEMAPKEDSCNHLDQVMDQWHILVKMVINSWIPYMEYIFFSRLLLQEASQFASFICRSPHPYFLEHITNKVKFLFIVRGCVCVWEWVCEWAVGEGRICV
jgi:hypothetical protein